MASMINTNIASLNAQRNLNTSQSSLTTSLQRLSSGLRINSAKDDAAGLAISERMSSQIKGNDQAVRNANDGISLAQTAEGDLAQIGVNLQRMRELAVQSSNATNSASDRAALNNEVQQLAAEIDRVAQNSSFNGVKLLDGTFTAQDFQVGANSTANDRVRIDSISSARTSSLGGVGTSFAATTSGTATTAALNAGDLTLNGFQVGASSLGSGPGQSTASAFSVAAAINKISSSSGVTATANVNTVTGSAASALSLDAIAANTFSINGINVGAVAADSNATGRGANLAAAINAVAAQTGVAASANATTGALTLTAADGRDISIGLNGAAAGATAALQTTAAATAKTNFLAQTGLATGVVGTQGTAGIATTTATAGTAITAGAFLTPPFAGSSLAAGAITANGVDVGAVTLGTGAFVAGTAATAAATSVLTLTGLTSGSSYTLTMSGAGFNGGVAADVTFVAGATDNASATALDAAITALGYTNSATLTLGANTITTSVAAVGYSVKAVRTAAEVTAGVTVAQKTVADTSATSVANASGFAISVAGTLGTQGANGAAYSAQELTTALNTALAAATGGAAVNGSVTSNATTGVMTYVAGSTDSLQFAITGTAADPTTATADQVALTTATGLTAGQLGTKASGTAATAGAAAANHGTISLSSTSSDGIVWAGAAATKAGLIANNTVAATVTSSVASIASVNVSTAAGANSALAAIDGALATVNGSRASLGAYQNRFASVVSSLQTTSENLTASRSRIQDTDFASETANLTRGQILQQAGTAMLAQANSLPQGVLALLRG